MHVASKALEYYAETVFKVPYPLRKSDLLAIPGAVNAHRRSGALFLSESWSLTSPACFVVYHSSPMGVYFPSTGVSLSP